MKWSNGFRKRLVLVGFVTAIVFCDSANADFTFGEPVNLGPTVNSSGVDCSPSVSTDGLELYFLSDQPGGYGNYDIWMATRLTTDDPWNTPVNLGPVVNSSDWEVSPDISADGLSLYFDGGPDNYNDLWVTKRTTKDQPWGTPVELDPNVNFASWLYCPGISPDGLQLYFESEDDLWFSTRQTQSDPWQPAVNLGSPVNSSYHDSGPDISIDGLAMFFHSDRPGGYGDQDLYMTTRKTIDSSWGEPINLGPNINTSYSESDPSVSADGRMLYFSEYPNPRPGGIGDLDIWQAPIIPIVDLNGDGIVNAADMCIMVDHWGEDYSLCDIGPMPWGDGVVDVEDLKVLAEHLFEEVFPKELIGYWKLDETEGDIAYNSVSDNHGVLSGNPTWQPDSGRIGGALQFDGIDDYISTDFVLNPADGSFSVFAWIKGGEPGQVILSQTGGVNWLSSDPSEGKLMTELVPPTTRSPLPPLVSETKITDGNWLHIGFVRSGASRTLYVDGVLVAEDMQNNLSSSNNGLYMGTGKNLEAGTFFSGLIDDIRIYNKALNAEQIAALAQ
jgi:Tol biopolymer transport system component